MDPVTMGLIAMGIGGAVKIAASLFDDTADRQAALINKEADLKQSALEETMRRAEGQQTQVLSSTKARMAGSGFASDSLSFKDYLTGMATEFQRQNDFQRESGEKSIELMRQGASMIADPMHRILQAITGGVETGVGVGGLLVGHG